MIKIKNLNKTYASRKTSHHALRNINLDFANTGLNFILGKSGCGKTTLMNLIGGLDKFDSGDIIVKHLSLANANNTDKDRLRNTVIGFIFQDFNLIEHMTVSENVSLSLKLLGNHTEEETLKLTKKTITDVGLGDLGSRKINELSGGQKQRVAIARALIKNPDILLCDEPTGNLDEKTSNNILELLKEISRTKLVIVVSHNDKLAYQYGERVINILDGQVIKDELTSGKSQNSTIKNLKFEGKYDFDKVADEVLGSIDNNVVVNARIINDQDEDSVSSNSRVKKKKYDIKNISMFKVLFKTSFGYFTLRKARLAVIAILMSFSLAIGAYMIGMYSYDSKEDTVKYLEQYDFALHSLECNKDAYKLEDYCDDSLYTEYIFNSELSEEKLPFMVNGLLESSLNLEIPGMTHSTYRDVYGEDIVNIMIDPSVNFAEYFDLASGSTNIVGNNDIYITDRIAYQIAPLLEPKDLIGTSVNSEDDTFIIKGVILTDFEDIDFESLGWEINTSVPYKYNLVFFNRNYIENKLDNTDVITDVRIRASNEWYVLYRPEHIAKESNHLGVDTELLLGSKPVDVNDVIVSRTFICDIMLNTDKDDSCNDGTSESELLVKFEKYLGTYVSNLQNDWNIASKANIKTFDNQLKIVGIMEDIDTVDNNVGFLVADETIELYNENLLTSGNKVVLLQEDEYEYFTGYIYDYKNDPKLAEKDYEIGFAAWDPDQLAFVSDLSSSSVFVILVLSVTFVFTLVSTVISNFNLAFIVENKKKEIGIFKSQGYRNRQLYLIFIMAIALQTILIVTIATILTILAMNMMNTIMQSSTLVYSGYDFITFGVDEFLYLFACTFIFGIISLYKPLKKMASTEPIDVIKNL